MNEENIQVENTEKISGKKENLKGGNEINLETQIIGWAGTIILITAYSLNSLGYLDTQNIIYPILNLFAAILLAIRVYASRVWANVFLEAFWGAIAIVSIIKYFI